MRDYRECGLRSLAKRRGRLSSRWCVRRSSLRPRSGKVSALKPQLVKRWRPPLSDMRQAHDPQITSRMPLADEFVAFSIACA